MPSAACPPCSRSSYITYLTVHRLCFDVISFVRHPPLSQVYFSLSDFIPYWEEKLLLPHCPTVCIRSSLFVMCVYIGPIRANRCVLLLKYSPCNPLPSIPPIYHPVNLLPTSFSPQILFWRARLSHPQALSVKGGCVCVCVCALKLPCSTVHILIKALQCFFGTNEGKACFMCVCVSVCSFIQTPRGAARIVSGSQCLDYT